MKYLVAFFSFVMALDASAGLITEVTTTPNQRVVDYTVQNFDADLGQITAE